MKFKLTHTFDHELAFVEAASFHPELFPYLTQEMADTVKEIQLLEQHDGEDTITRKVRYLPHPIIRKVGPKEIPHHYMEWVEHSTYDKKSRVLTFENIPTAPKVRDRMTNNGSFRLECAGDGTCRRLVAGELKVRFPILGIVAERIIYSHAQKILNDEALAFTRFLAQLS